jgi:hypothetical protein
MPHPTIWNPALLSIAHPFPGVPPPQHQQSPPIWCSPARRNRRQRRRRTGRRCRSRSRGSRRSSRTHLPPPPGSCLPPGSGGSHGGGPASSRSSSCIFPLSVDEARAYTMSFAPWHPRPGAMFSEKGSRHEGLILDGGRPQRAGQASGLALRSPGQAIITRSSTKCHPFRQVLRIGWHLERAAHAKLAVEDLAPEYRVVLDTRASAERWWGRRARLVFWFDN